ncbi:hypothetical protein M3202_06455 [Alkalihalobacillus oceani]|uniref:Uncharacterized protein n=1 Tax=Halalkalibacter oceani TaxID=1653776 RepID=A0A9X2INF0_9BACI|nr:hypothetical protein [Halalkalibacter oceani]MCM3713721.1 hypothetical protein [Halalkalibacter oceani]
MKKKAVVAGRRLEGKHLDRLQTIMKEAFKSALKIDELVMKPAFVEEEKSSALKEASIMVVMISEPEETYRR